jgi:hypothetical protein
MYYVRPHSACALDSHGLFAAKLSSMLLWRRRNSVNGLGIIMLMGIIDFAKTRETCSAAIQWLTLEENSQNWM